MRFGRRSPGGVAQRAGLEGGRRGPGNMAWETGPGEAWLERRGPGEARLRRRGPGRYGLGNVGWEEAGYGRQSLGRRGLAAPLREGLNQSSW